MQAQALRIAASFALSLGAPAFAAAPGEAGPRGSTEIVFTQPERYIDAGDGPAEVRANLALLQRTLQELGQKWLQPGQSLRIEVEQVDLAGRVEPALRHPQPLRVLRGGADWPRIDFKYTLSTAATGAQESGTASISDQAYLLHPITHTGEPLRYERRMLAQWFRHRFGERPAAP
ncbi:DUF3016 domain-containing protein [uncultured Azohydromonas sp.]|jgi:Protein of unknown function (DUF3016).|uniref:DUF3016 domain-containing protein n=1 Tax=uncultured Azohydromonas sp. TaxID=487342 RepID=UPI00262FEA85|nr:DUF3016 domain-containing protein [uncultured Azohydromonas sp.]